VTATTTERVAPTRRDDEPGAAPKLGAALVVWGTLAALTGYLLFSVGRYAKNVPNAEDWNMVRPLFNDQPDFLHWIWAQNDEHRSPIHRLIQLGLLKATHDFRSGMVFDILLMAAVAALLVLAARTIRGRTAVSDAFIPILLLHVGNWENLLWSWQMQFVIVTAALLVVLAAFATAGRRISGRWLAAVGAIVVLLPLGGGTALPMVPLVLAGVIALACWRGERRRSMRIGAAVVGGLTLAVIGWYFVGWVKPTGYPPNPGPRGTLATTAKVFAMAWGPINQSGTVAWALGGLLAATAAGSAIWVLVRAFRDDRPDRSVIVALGAYLGATFVTALALGYGRAGRVPIEGLAGRYTYVTMPALLAVYFIWLRFGPPRVASGVLAGLLIAALLMTPFNVNAARDWRAWYAAGQRQLDHDIAAGIPRAQLVDRNQEFLLHWDHDLLAHDIELLRCHHFGVFAHVRPDPAARAADPLGAPACPADRLTAANRHR
jgi:hypothetical protein